jgi:hypothetical protein
VRRPPSPPEIGLPPRPGSARTSAKCSNTSPRTSRWFTSGPGCAVGRSRSSRRRRCRSSGVGRVQACSPMSCWPSTATTLRSIGRAPSTPGLGRARALHARRLGGPGGVPARTLGRGDHPSHPCRCRPSCGRHAGAGAGSRARQDQDRPIVGAGSGRTALGRPRATGRRPPLLVRPQGEHARALLAGCRGFLHAAAMPASMASASPTRAARHRWSRLPAGRRAAGKLFDVDANTGSAIAKRRCSGSRRCSRSRPRSTATAQNSATSSGRNVCLRGLRT